MIQYVCQDGFPSAAQCRTPCVSSAAKLSSMSSSHSVWPWPPIICEDDDTPMAVAGLSYDANEVLAAPVAPGGSANAGRPVKRTSVRHDRTEKRRPNRRSTDASAQAVPRRRGGDHRKHVHVPEKIVKASAFLANFVAKAMQFVASPFRWKEI